MHIMFETMHFDPERMIDNWIEKAWIDHENISDFLISNEDVLREEGITINLEKD
mgnify:CR=1 FL=1